MLNKIFITPDSITPFVDVEEVLLNDKIILWCDKCNHEVNLKNPVNNYGHTCDEVILGVDEAELIDNEILLKDIKDDR